MQLQKENMNDILTYIESNGDGQLIGMEDAKKAMYRVWTDASLDLGAKNEVKSVLLVGPPGTGKTQMCITAAEIMGRKTTFLSMANTYSVKQRIYTALKQDPFQVIILDELEKAKKEIQDEILDVIEYGEFTAGHDDPQNDTFQTPAVAHKAIFFATSNAAAYDIQQTSLLDDRSLRQAVIADGISEPVVSRFQSVIAVKNPTFDEFKLALKMKLDRELEREGKKKNVQFILADEECFLGKAAELYLPTSDYRQVGHIVIHVVREGIRDILLEAYEIQRAFEPGEAVEIQWKQKELDLLKGRRTQQELARREATRNLGSLAICPRVEPARFTLPAIIHKTASIQLVHGVL